MAKRRRKRPAAESAARPKSSEFEDRQRAFNNQEGLCRSWPSPWRSRAISASLAFLASTFSSLRVCIMKRRRKRPSAKSPTKPKSSEFEVRQRAFNNQEVERRIAAIRAIQVAEVESLLGRLRLIRLYFTKEQLEAPALQFFQENLPNISLVNNEKSKIVELKRNDVEDGGGNRQAVGSAPFSVRSVKSNFFDIANLQIPNFVLDDMSENQMAGNAFQTPGESSNRLSFGLTPKTSRLPKKGEMLMSVRGSPLGVYEEENLEAIHESGDGTRDVPSQ